MRWHRRRSWGSCLMAVVGGGVRTFVGLATPITSRPMPSGSFTFLSNLYIRIYLIIIPLKIVLNLISLICEMILNLKFLTLLLGWEPNFCFKIY